jgi:hypothetical protein
VGLERFALENGKQVGTLVRARLMVHGGGSDRTNVLSPGFREENDRPTMYRC